MSGTAQQVSGSEVKSPTTLVLDYMRSKGVDPASSGFSQKLRAVLEESARNPDLIAGLRSDRPSTDAEDQAAMLDKATGTRRALPVPPIPPQGQTTGPMDRRGTEGDPTTSAAPSSGLDITLPAIAAAVLGGGSLGAYARSRMGGGAVSTPGGAVPPVPDVGAGVPGAAGAEPEPGRVMRGIAENPVSPAAVALDRATENAPVISGVKPVSPTIVPPSPGPTEPVGGAEVPRMLSPAERAAIRARAPGMNVRPRIPFRVP